MNYHMLKDALNDPAGLVSNDGTTRVTANSPSVIALALKATPLPPLKTIESKVSLAKKPVLSRCTDDNSWACFLDPRPALRRHKNLLSEENEERVCGGGSKLEIVDVACVSSWMVSTVEEESRRALLRVPHEALNTTRCIPLTNIYNNKTPAHAHARSLNTGYCYINGGVAIRHEAFSLD